MDLAATIAKMRVRGMSAEAIVTALECIVMSDAKMPAIDEQAERRRAADRARKAAKRAEIPQNSAESADMVSPLVPPLSPAPLSPPIIPPSISVLRLNARELETELREAAGWQNQPAPNLCVTGEIEAMIDAGAILETDVLPVIRAHAPKVRRPSSWRYFVPIIRDAMESRIAVSTGPPIGSTAMPFASKPLKNGTANAPRPNTIAAGFELIDRVIAAEERAIAEAEIRAGRSTGDPLALP